jgi:arsenic resistance protein ArsH
MQVSGRSQSFNAVNASRMLERWMRMETICIQSSLTKAYQWSGLATKIRGRFCR